ncbi:MAG TPA: three-Cys-motif partner protein TcmP [Thermoanaerobaculia bacterium]|nr:three-Cys-motif partner protein TcmP [Thermoanaerobaculia bacterium]
MSARRIEIPILDDDGLYTPDVGDWAEDKYRRHKLYATLFTNSMRDKWKQLVYVDLFAGAGRSRVRPAGRIIPASPVLALSLKHPFDRYVFSEADPKRMQALKARVARDYGDADVSFLAGDVNQQVGAVLSKLPPKGNALTFCFADPFSFKNLPFATIQRLADRYIDFLVLIPTGYDATRNERRYVFPDNPTVDSFLGRRDWRDDWLSARAGGQTFDHFITDSFGAAMRSLGYIYGGIESSELIRSTKKHARLYRLVLFSRHSLGSKFWGEARKYSSNQRQLPF